MKKNRRTIRGGSYRIPSWDLPTSGGGAWFGNRFRSYGFRIVVIRRRKA